MGWGEALVLHVTRTTLSQPLPFEIMDQITSIATSANHMVSVISDIVRWSVVELY